MILLKKLKLINFCGFRNFEVDLSIDEGKQGKVKKWLMVSGPNGIGKSNLLNAISLLSSPWRLKSRKDNILFFRRLTYHPDYIPNYEGFDKNKTNLYIEAVFLTPQGEKKVIIENNWDIVASGVIIDELPSDVFSVSFYVDANNPINTQKFQIVSEYKKEFLDFAETVYGFECNLPPDRYVEEYNSQKEDYIGFYTDFVITKYNNTKVHYKRMSAGEKKIATMLTELFNNIYNRNSEENNILLIDNIDLHIYWKRHMSLIRKMKQYFPNNQIIATTHSPVIIKEMDNKYLLDLEKCVS